MADPFLERLAEAYYAYYRDNFAGQSDAPSSAGFDVWQAVESLVRIPELGLDVIFALMPLASTDRPFAAFVAAGPLEDVVNGGSPSDLLRLRNAAFQNDTLSNCLKMIRASAGSPARLWLDEIHRQD